MKGNFVLFFIISGIIYFEDSAAAEAFVLIAFIALCGVFFGKGGEQGASGIVFIISLFLAFAKAKAWI